MKGNRYDLDMDEIKVSFLAGQRIDDIAARMYVSNDAVIKRVKDMGLIRPSPRLVKIIDKEILIEKYVNDRKSFETLAAEEGYTIWQIKKSMVYHNIPANPKGGVEWLDKDELIRRYINNGESLACICESMCIGIKRLRENMRRYNIEIPPNGKGRKKKKLIY